MGLRSRRRSIGGLNGLVWGLAFDAGNLVQAKRLRASMGRHTTTGHGLCAEHQKLAGRLRRTG